jgi:hypothetical protein
MPWFICYLPVLLYLLFHLPKMPSLHHSSPHACQENYYTALKNVHYPEIFPSQGSTAVMARYSSPQDLEALDFSTPLYHK